MEEQVNALTHATPALGKAEAGGRLQGEHVGRRDQCPPHTGGCPGSGQRELAPAWVSGAILSQQRLVRVLAKLVHRKLPALLCP